MKRGVLHRLDDRTRVRVMQLLGGICLVWLALDAARFPDSSEDIASALGVMQPSMQPAALALRAAEAGWSRIEVEVRRNDTLDQIFRRLELPLSDLANLRAMSELRTALDRLQPGELLTLSHKAGELMGLERRISPSEVLQVRRDADDSFVATIHETPLTRTPATTGASSILRFLKLRLMPGSRAGLPWPSQTSSAGT